MSLSARAQKHHRVLLNRAATKSEFYAERLFSLVVRATLFNVLLAL
jgi:hypothetical protein